VDQYELVVEKSNKLLDQLIEWRRMFHQYPELSFQEYVTSRYIAAALRDIAGMKIETGIGINTSVIGTLSSGEGPTIALRANIAALPIKERNSVPYASRNVGVMHACGHDAHTAILLGVAHVLGE